MKFSGMQPARAKAHTAESIEADSPAAIREKSESIRAAKKMNALTRWVPRQSALILRIGGIPRISIASCCRTRELPATWSGNGASYAKAVPPTRTGIARPVCKLTDVCKPQLPL